MHLNGRNIEFAKIKRVWVLDYIDEDGMKSSCYHPYKKMLIEHTDFLKKRGCKDFSELHHDWVLYDQDDYVYPFPQSELKWYRNALKQDLKAQGGLV